MRFLWRTRTHYDEFSFLLLNLDNVFLILKRIQLQEKSPAFDQSSGSKVKFTQFFLCYIFLLLNQVSPIT